MSDKIQKLSDSSGSKPKRQKHDLVSFTNAAILVHGGRYNYTNVVWVNGVTKVVIECSDHGPFNQYPFHHLAGNGCKLCGIKARSGRNAIPHKKMRDGMQVAPNVEIDTYQRFTLRCQSHGKVQVRKSATTNGNCPKCQTTSSGWKLYKARVRSETEWQWKNRNQFFNPKNLPRGKFEYHIDHQFSTREAFDLAIPVYIVAHWSNLHMLHWTDNIHKGSDSIVSSDLLLRNYFWAIKHFNETT